MKEKWIIVDEAVPKGSKESYRYRGSRRWADTIKQAVPFTSWDEAVENLNYVLESCVALRPVIHRVRPKVRDARWIIVDKSVPRGRSCRYIGRLCSASTISDAGPFASREEAVRFMDWNRRPSDFVIRRVRSSRAKARLDAALLALGSLEREVDTLTDVVDKVLTTLGARERETVIEAARRVVRERDEARALEPC